MQTRFHFFSRLGDPPLSLSHSAQQDAERHVETTYRRHKANMYAGVFYFYKKWSAPLLWLIYKIMFKHEDTARYYEKGEVNHRLCSIHISLTDDGLNIRSLDRDAFIGWDQIRDISFDTNFITFMTDYGSSAYIPRRAMKGPSNGWEDLHKSIISRKNAANTAS